MSIEIMNSLFCNTLVGTDAINCFKNLQIRHGRNKKVSGRDGVEEAENQGSEPFKYLRWLDPYYKKRQTTSNLLGNSEPTCLTYDESETRGDGSETFEIQYSDQSATPNSDTETSSNYSLTRDDMISETTGQLKYRKKKKTEHKKVA